MAKNPARATRLNRQVPLKLATDSQAKKAAEQETNKARMKAMGKPATRADKMKLAVANFKGTCRFSRVARAGQRNR